MRSWPVAAAPATKATKATVHQTTRIDRKAISARVIIKVFATGVFSAEWAFSCRSARLACPLGRAKKGKSYTVGTRSVTITGFSGAKVASGGRWWRLVEQVDGGNHQRPSCPEVLDCHHRPALLSSPMIQTSIAVAQRVHGFSYAIRNIVAEARKVEAAGRTVQYLNIGDPTPFGFEPPAGAVEAFMKALRDGRNGYVPSPGIPEAREAVAHEWSRIGFPAEPDRVLITGGTSEGIELTLTALVNPGGGRARPVTDLSAVYRGARKDRRGGELLSDRPRNGWLPDLAHLESLITPRTRALVVIDPNNPTGAVYPDAVRRSLIGIAERHGLVILADEVYGDLAYDGRSRRWAAWRPKRPSFLFRACRRRTSRRGGARAGWSWARAGGSTTCSPRSRNSRTDACAATARPSTRLPRRCSAIAPIRRASGRRSARGGCHRQGVHGHPWDVVRGAPRRLLRDAARWNCRPVTPTSTSFSSCSA